MKIKNQGSGLENTVAEIYRDLGYIDVKQNVRLSKKSGNPINAQIDICYKDLLGNTIYVECKYHKDKKVSFEEYAKFCQVLNTSKIPKLPFLYRGELVTNNYFDERTKISAERERIHLIDGDELNYLDDKRKHGIRLLVPLIRLSEIYKDKGLQSALDYLLKRSLSLSEQIKSYMK